MLALGVLACLLAKDDKVVAKARFVWSTGAIDVRWLVQWYTVLAILCPRNCTEKSACGPVGPVSVRCLRS